MFDFLFFLLFFFSLILFLSFFSFNKVIGQSHCVLTNPSSVPAKWSIEHIPEGVDFTKTNVSVRGYEEEEESEYIDDPRVFHFKLALFTFLPFLLFFLSSFQCL